MSHSKRNTSRAVFTSHERDVARQAWSSTSARLSRESFLPFSSCGLCLEIARDPVSCTHGDLFCRECALSNILAQRKEIKRLEKLREQEERDAEEERIRQEEEARERAVREFEMTQIGLDVKAKSGTNNKDASGATGEHSTPPAAESSNGGKKRKFEMDEEELARIAKEDRAKARKAIEDEKAAKPVLPSFWTPSVATAAKTNESLHEIAKKQKSTPMCPAARENSPHTYSLHTLVTVNFTEEDEGDESRGNGTSSNKKKRIRVCPSCKKGLSNSSKAMLAKPCGHVLCRNCVDKFMRPSRHHDPHAVASEAEKVRCYVCEADLTEKSVNGNDTIEKGKKKDKEKIRPGLVELRSEGTGFSAGGANQVRKSGVSFQC
ncbi:ENOS interacting protein [Annulohypoxylon truncatum]|uniref:ENOS interacting protein n=1 Tax=Annulohypoxylon truncatum TaxID=327061 RepID=UPI00200727B5|nr:ENOS interacting protein [Annulohypoxylon truncatum]KAI1212196.1 ENOS interacting protein [Annulohypoxylon truncatum]